MLRDGFGRRELSLGVFWPFILFNYFINLVDLAEESVTILVKSTFTICLETIIFLQFFAVSGPRAPTSPVDLVYSHS